MHRLTGRDGRRYGDNIFHIQHVLAVLDVLRGAFGRIYIVFDGLTIDRDEEKSKRGSILASEYARLTSKLQTDATLPECCSNMPIYLSTCLFRALVEYAAMFPDHVMLERAEGDKDATTARLALEKEREVPGSTVAVLSHDTDMLFFKGCTAASLRAVELDKPNRRGLTLSLLYWQDRCRLVLPPDVSPDSQAAVHYMSTLAVVLGNERVSVTTFQALRPKSTRGTRLTIQDIALWLEARHREVAEPSHLLGDLIQRLPPACRARADVIKRAARWYWPDEVQLPDLGMLGDNRGAILHGLQRFEISMSLLEMVIHGHYHVNNLLQPVQVAGSSCWAEPPLARLEPVLCHLVCTFGGWLHEMGWTVAAENFNAARVKGQAKTVRGTDLCAQEAEQRRKAAEAESAAGSTGTNSQYRRSADSRAAN